MTLLDQAKRKLYEKRLQRPAPILDDKVISAWNGLMISAFAKASSVLNRADYRLRATAAAEFVWDNLWNGKRLGRAWHGGKVRYDGFLDDYAFMIAGLLNLYEVSQEPKWFKRALRLQRHLDTHFRDPAGGCFFVGEAGDTLLARDKPDYDGALPTGNSVAAINLLRLSLLTGDVAYDRAARELLTSFGQTLLRSGRAMPKMLTGLDFVLDQALQIIVVRPTEEANSDVFHKIIHERFLPNRVVLSVTDDEIPELAKSIALIRDKKNVGSQPTVYICRGTSCSLPITDASSLKKDLAWVKPYSL